MGGSLGKSGTGRVTHPEVQDGLTDTRRGPEWVRGPSRRSATVWGP